MEKFNIIRSDKDLQLQGSIIKRRWSLMFLAYQLPNGNWKIEAKLGFLFFKINWEKEIEKGWAKNLIKDLFNRTNVDG